MMTFPSHMAIWRHFRPISLIFFCKTILYANMTEEQQIEYALKMSLQGGNDEEDEDMAE